MSKSGSASRARSERRSRPSAGSSRAYFDEIGSTWDEMRKEFFPEHVRDRALEIAGIEAGQIAADLGAGTGFLTEALLARGVSVIAVDQSPVMLDALRGKYPERVSESLAIRAAGVDAPRDALLVCRVGESRNLPLDDASVDSCLANMYLHHVDDPAAAIQEMARVLRPGGVAVITDLDTHRHTWLREGHHDRWLGFARDDVRDWFRTAGLTDVRVDDVGDRCRADSASGCCADISIFVASGRKG